MARAARLRDCACARGPGADEQERSGRRRRGLVRRERTRVALARRRPAGLDCTFEGKRRFPHFGINISVLSRRGIGHVPPENGQEAFLVLAGECTLIVEGKERPLTRGTSSTAYRETEHIIVAAGEQSAVVLAVVPAGEGRRWDRLHGLQAAARYGASVARETTKPADRVRERSRDAAAVEVRQVPAGLAHGTGTVTMSFPAPQPSIVEIPTNGRLRCPSCSPT